LDFSDWYEDEWSEVDDPSKLKSTAVLLFGDIMPGRRAKGRGVFFGQEAYEGYCLVYYLRELLGIREAPHIARSLGMMHHLAMDYIYAGAATIADKGIYFQEVGATLYSMIDRLDAMEKLHRKGVNIEKIMFASVEMSKYFRLASKALHPTCNLVLAENLSEVPRLGINKVNYSYMATSYAFDSTDEFIAWLDQGKCSVMTAWCSTTDDEFQSETFGKNITLFSFPEIHRRLAETGHRVIMLDAHCRKHFNFDFAFTSFVVTKFDEEEDNKFRRLLAEVSPEAEPQEISRDPTEHFRDVCSKGEFISHALPFGTPEELQAPGGMFDFSTEELEKMFFDAYPAYRALIK